MLEKEDVRTYVSEAEYDSWNRIRKMVYPDGETVTYGYDKAGQLNSMTSEKDGFTYDFITSMTYDVYGNISTKTYGNGTSTRYTYDPKRQHLTNMVATNGAGEFINATYKYDNIDNILGIDNTAKPVSTIGGTSHHRYTYDDFSRLVSAEGSCKDGSVAYSLSMEYDVMSNPLRKNQTISGSTVATSHNLQYLYKGEKPDAASQIGQDRYTYDANGNPVLVVNDSTTRTMTWDEENRLVVLNDDGYASRYTYDHTGTRAIRSHGPLESVYINGAEQGLDYHDADNYTLYVSPYLIVTNDRFTKHYYAGTQRIASKVGSGDFYNVYGVNGFHLTAGQKDYEERLVQMEQGVKQYYRENGIPPGVPTQKGSNADPYQTGVALPNVPLGNYDVPQGWPTNVRFNPPGDVPGPPVQFESDDMGDVKAGYGFESDHTYEGDWFFFHTDHLGSTSYLTDTAGNVSQFVWYAPYGEALVDEHTTTYENPFKFSGKELDDITGLYDHGARSRNPVTTLWYGVDPLFDKNPEYGPYIYCVANPVVFVDPDGRDALIMIAPEGAGNRGHMGAIIQDKNKNCYYITAGASEQASVCGMIFSGCKGDMLFEQLYKRDENGNLLYDGNGNYIPITDVKEAFSQINYVDMDNSEYTDYVTINTTTEQDEKIIQNALIKQEKIRSGREQYNPITNNCAQTIIECIENGTGIDIKDGITPCPNDKFDNIKQSEKQK